MFCARQQRADHRDQRDQNARHHVVLVVERRVVPAADVARRCAARRGAAAPRRPPHGPRCGRSRAQLRRVRAQDARRVRLHDAGGRSLLGVDVELDRRGARPHERRLEVVRDRQHHRHVAAQQRVVGEIERRRLTDDPEMAGRPEPVDQPARRARAVEVDDVDRRVADLEGGGVRQHQQLHDRQHEHLRQRRAVAHHVQDFGPREEQDAAHRAQLLQPLVERPRAHRQQDQRHRDQHQRLPPQIREADALEHDAARDEHEPARRHDVRDASAAAAACSRSGR